MPPHRSGPLQELPLERFLPPDTNVPLTPSKHARPKKRPHSPGGPSLSSATKRRILDGEGISSPRTIASTSTSSRTSGRFAPSYFNTLLQGPDSPAKKLDFGSAKSKPDSRLSADSSRGGATPVQNRSLPVSSRKLVPSPKLVAPSQSTPYSNFFTEADVEMTDLRDQPSSSSHIMDSFMIPREIIAADRQSVHYPGFDIFQDAYTAIGTSSNPVPDSELKEDDAQTDRSDSLSSKREKEADKENVQPRRRTRKAVIAPAASGDAAWIKAGLVSPRVKPTESSKVKAILFTPHRKNVYSDLSYEDNSRTPMRRSIRLSERKSSMLISQSPERTPIGKEERRTRRAAMAMEDEADDVDDY